MTTKHNPNETICYKSKWGIQTGLIKRITITDNGIEYIVDDCSVKEDDIISQEEAIKYHEEKAIEFLTEDVERSNRILKVFGSKKRIKIILEESE